MDKLVLLALLVTVMGWAMGDKIGKMGKSIVYDIKTPKVFYCPQEKPKDWNDVLVKSRPLSKLCEYEGKRPLPADMEHDCYDDLDETEYACQEKQRIMTRLLAPEETVSIPQASASPYSTEL